MSTSTLTASRVEAIFRDCLYRDGESVDRPIIVDGLSRQFGFHPGRLSSHGAEIKALLGELPRQFRSSHGWPFGNACLDRHSRLWANDQRQIEQLFGLGMAIGKVKYLLPRELWEHLPGSMPYLMIIL